MSTIPTSNNQPDIVNENLKPIADGLSSLPSNIVKTVVNSAPSLDSLNNLPNTVSNIPNTIANSLPSIEVPSCKKICSFLDFNLDTLNIILILIIAFLIIYTFRNKFI